LVLAVLYVLESFSSDFLPCIMEHNPTFGPVERPAIAALVSRRYLPALWIDPLTTLLDRFDHLAATGGPGLSGSVL